VAKRPPPVPGRGRGNPRWRKGVSGNPAGRPKGSIEFATRMRLAFTDPSVDPAKKRTLTDVVLAMAFDDDNPKQTWAIQFVAAYGIGLPKRSLDDEAVKALATEMMEQALEEARKRRALAAQEDDTGQVDQ
jgi:hypothetical protein